MKFHKKLLEWREHSWCIGIVNSSLDHILNGGELNINWVFDPESKTRWFADPFILDYTDKYIYILAEEFSYSLRKGRIAKLTINRDNYCIEKCDIILELDSHLSFPFIIRKEDKVSVMPENSASGGLRLYSMAKGTLTVESQVSPYPLTDAIVFENQGKYYLIGTQIPTQNGTELLLWKYDCVAGKTIGDCHTIQFNSCVARNAGACFLYKGTTYRPAQDCNETYGGGVIIQKCVRNSDGFSFQNIMALYPRSKRYNMGLHTFNVYKNMIVVDGNGYRYPRFGNLANRVYKLLSHLKHL